MLDELTVKDLYLPLAEYPHVAASACIRDVIGMVHDELAKSRHFRTILVHDDRMRLQGFLSISDLIRAVGPHYLRKQQSQTNRIQTYQDVLQDFSGLALIWQDGFEIKVKEAAKKSVAQAMSLFDHTVQLADPLAKCAYLMVIHDGLILPVVESGKVIGVVRLVDVFEKIAATLATHRDSPT